MTLPVDAVLADRYQVVELRGRSRMVMGSVPYMTPEQLDDRAGADPRSSSMRWAE